VKQEAHEILKRALAQHREQLLSGKHACLGILWDYGGREHLEVNLLADAVEEHIPDRLLHSQPVTGDIIGHLAESFAAKRLYDSNAAKFAVASWADALGLFQLDPSFFTQSAIRPAPGSPPIPEMKRIAEQTTSARFGNLLTSTKRCRKSSTAGDTRGDGRIAGCRDQIAAVPGKRVVQRREAERQRVEAERQRVVEEQQRVAEEQQRIEAAQQPTEAVVNRRSNLRKNRGVWLLSSMAALIYGAIYLVIGWRAYHLWLADGSGLGPGSGMIAVGATGVLFLVILLATLGKIHEWAADSIQRGSQADHFAAIVWLAIATSAGIALNYWSLASDTRLHVAMLASVVILPMIPLIRELLALVIVSIVAGLLAYFAASLGVSATGSLVAWVSHAHPITTTAKPEAKPATADEAQAPHAQTPGRPAMIDDKDGWSNLRHAPSPTSTIIRRIQRTEVFYVNGTNDSWCHVVTDAGEEGWMHRTVIKFNE